MGFVNTWLTLSTTKKHHLSLNLVYAENEHRMVILSIFALVN